MAKLLSWNNGNLLLIFFSFLIMKQNCSCTLPLRMLNSDIKDVSLMINWNPCLSFSLEIPHFSWNISFITVFTTDCHWNSTQSDKPTSLKLTVILSSYLCQGLLQLNFSIFMSYVYYVTCLSHSPSHLRGTYHLDRQG